MSQIKPFTDPYTLTNNDLLVLVPESPDKNIVFEEVCERVAQLQKSGNHTKEYGNKSLALTVCKIIGEQPGFVTRDIHEAGATETKISFAIDKPTP